MNNPLNCNIMKKILLLMILCLLGCFAARSQTYTATLPIDNYYDIEGESVFETEAFYTIAELCFSNGYRPVDAAGAKSQLEC